VLPFAISCYSSPGLKVIKLSDLSLEAQISLLQNFQFWYWSILESELETQLKKFYNLRAWLQYDFTDYHDYEWLSATTKMFYRKCKNLNRSSKF